MQNELNTAEWVSKTAKKHGAEQVSVSVVEEKQTDITIRMGELERLQDSKKYTLNLGIYIGGRYSTNSTNDLRKESLKEFVKNAVELAKYLAPDEYRALPDPSYYPKKIDLKALEIFDPDQANLTIAQRISTVKSIEESVRKTSDKIISASADVNDRHIRTLLFHSNGFSASVEETNVFMFAEASVRDGQRGLPEDYWFGSSRFWKGLPDSKWIGERVAKGALNRIGQEKIGSGKYTMLVENKVGQRLMYLLTEPMRGNNIQQKRSYLDGKIGAKIASEKLTLIDNPLLVRGIGSRAFDGEAIASQQRVMIEKGVLRNYYIDNYYGRKLKMEPTSGSISNVIISCGEKTQGELIKEIKKVIFVTGFIGGNSNSTTGDFSIGIVGQLIENGEIVKPVNGMNIAGNSKELWNQLIETANDPFEYSSFRCPTMLFENVSFSGA